MSNNQNVGSVITNDEGAMLRPDFALFMPDGKSLIIDSKVSLTAFVDYANATSPELQQQALKQHIASVKAQVDLLAKKEYTTSRPIWRLCRAISSCGSMPTRNTW